MGNRKAEHSELLATHKGSRDIKGLRLHCPLALPVLNMRHSVQAVSAQRRQKKKKSQNGSALAPKNRTSTATNSVLFTSDICLR